MERQTERYSQSDTEPENIEPERHAAGLLQRSTDFLRGHQFYDGD